MLMVNSWPVQFCESMVMPKRVMDIRWPMLEKSIAMLATANSPKGSSPHSKGWSDDCHSHFREHLALRIVSVNVHCNGGDCGKKQTTEVSMGSIT